MIKVGQLQLTFNKGTPIENHVLRGLNLNIKKGEFVTIIGSNGAGKSSLPVSYTHLTLPTILLV